MLILTPEMIEQLRTPAGGFNRATMDAVGIEWPLRDGWKQLAVGRKVSNKSWEVAQRAKTEKLHRYRGNTRRYR